MYKWHLLLQNDINETCVSCESCVTFSYGMTASQSYDDPLKNFG